MVCDLLDETLVDATKNSPRCQDLYRANDLCSWRFESLILCFYMYFKRETKRRLQSTPWRNGSASDSRSEGCVFKSRRGQVLSFYFCFQDNEVFDFQRIIYAAYGTKQSTCLISSHVSLNLLQYSHFVLFRERSELFAV